jgi:hypothetical protein
LEGRKESKIYRESILRSFGFSAQKKEKLTFESLKNMEVGGCLLLQIREGIEKALLNCKCLIKDGFDITITSIN